MEIIQSYTDKRILYRQNDKNMGLVATLNKGIEMVDTEFLARMDADDLWHPSKLEKQIKLLDKRQDIGLCGTSIHKFGASEGDFIFPVDNEGLKVGFLFYCCMSHPSVVFRMSFLKNSALRYRADYFPAEDYKMWADCLDKTQIYNIPEVLVYYRQHDRQITQDTNKDQSEKTNKIRLEMLDLIYPQINIDEKKFHLETFIEQKILSIDDYQKCITWKKKLELKNKENGYYIQPQILNKELDKYLQVVLKGYILFRYFKKFSIPNGLRYACSFDWRYLSLKRNMSLFYKCIF
jgi:glycosyltransferase involved in cell wall biosynthesis